MNAPRDISYEANLTQALTDPQEAAAYLDAVMEMANPAALLLALRQVASRAAVGDKTLLNALSETRNPTLDTVTKVLHAVGLRLSVAPLPA